MSLLQPLLTHAHAWLVDAVCAEETTFLVTLVQGHSSTRVWHLGLRLEGSRWAGLPVTEDLESCSILATHATVKARTHGNCLKQGLLGHGCAPQRLSIKA